MKRLCVILIVCAAVAVGIKILCRQKVTVEQVDASKVNAYTFTQGNPWKSK